ncbi:aminoimidazole riboside kinase [Jeotgalibacillus sp. ET6]|uniref:aminoimidazole riboside kinase n=1 Tax=Jeotgalibacillus sp. ET6 TaxID=3037260 RepID=UPI0024185536|nr:aminoimidazole riboside kinase [Jeotgalibacillus sp. ET6]MDG5471092.1 aminoimidazole riboside kinase [Jeotgalibacillus sp. ET6]
MKSGIITLGEALIDFIPLDESNSSYHKSPGGAPANVAVGVARLGIESHFIGKVGEDVLGRFLKDTLNSYGVNTDSMKLTRDHRTGVVFVTLAEGGERSFDFYIDPSADRFLTAEELNDSVFEQSKIFHFGSISMISEPSKGATQKAVELAKKHGLLVSYDPNLRLSLWENPEQARRTIVSMLDQVDVLKISEEELEFLTGTFDIQKGVEVLQNYPIPLILITMGAEGSHLYTKEGHLHVPARKVQAVDTTGAGDAFVSGVLYGLHEHQGNLESMTIEEAAAIVQLASNSGALAASTKGAMTALPTIEEVKHFHQK